MQSRGVVLSLDGHHAVVLTSSGEFCRINAPTGAEVGMEVSLTRAPRVIFGHHMSHARRMRRISQWATVGIAACLAAIGIGVWQQKMTLEHQPYAYVALDITPAVQMTVDRQLHVLSVAPLDSNGQSLLTAVHVKQMSLPDAVHALMKGAADGHMIPAHDNILIATAPATTATDVADVQRTVQTQVQSVITTSGIANHLHPRVYSYQVSEEVWDAANELKISPAKFAVEVVTIHNGFHVKLNQIHQANLMIENISSALATTPTESGTAGVVDVKDPKQVKSLVNVVMDAMKSGSQNSSGKSGHNGTQSKSPASQSGLGIPLSPSASSAQERSVQPPEIIQAGGLPTARV